MFRPISRRTVLKGLGAALALPLLDAMVPFPTLAAPTTRATPKRLAFLYVPNGVHMPDWTPTAAGADYTLPPLLEPLKPFKQDFLLLSNLALDKARPNGDGPGDHARANSVFLTGCQPRKTAGADLRVGVSVDQLAAQRLGVDTRLPSLEIGCEAGKDSGGCDSGYSCAYSAHLSWRTESTPMPTLIDPRQIFERLFSGEGPQSALRRDRQSILDFVADDAQRLRGALGSNDQRKLDEYLTCVRDLEARIQRAEKTAAGAPPVPATTKPAGIPKEYSDHLKLLADLMVLAFQCDLTRVCSFAFANDGSNRPYKFLDVPEGHHDLSHHGGDAAKHEKIKKINRFHVTQLAYLLERLKSIKEGDGTLLDNCLIVYGSGIGDGDRHNHDDLPILLAGKGGGTVTPGRHLRYAKDTPLMNLYVSLLERVGAPVASFGDSTGRLTDIGG
jgi:hypothetical protein